MSKRPKTQWTKNASPKIYLTNTIKQKSQTKVIYPLNKEHSQYLRHP